MIKVIKYIFYTVKWEIEQIFRNRNLFQVWNIEEFIKITTKIKVIKKNKIKINQTIFIIQFEFYFDRKEKNTIRN